MLGRIFVRLSLNYNGISQNPMNLLGDATDIITELLFGSKLIEQRLLDYQLK